MKKPPKISILGVGISQTTLENALKTIHQRLKSRTPNRLFFIATPNPEMLVLASRDDQFRRILNSADLAVPDGVGIVWAINSQLRTPDLIERISGVDLMLKLCKLAAQKGYSVGLLGGREGVAGKTKEILGEKFPGIKIKFTISELSTRVLPARAGPASAHLARFVLSPASVNVDFLFVAFGAPKQEKFIYQLTKKPPAAGRRLNAKVAMGVGGAFDLISGQIKRAPLWMQKIGLEWLWRLIQEPWRIGRIINATVVFPFLVAKELFSLHFSHK